MTVKKTNQELGLPTEIDPGLRAELICGKLVKSPLYHTYQRAFRDATGLPLIVESGKCRFTFDECGDSNQFCQLLNQPHRKFSCIRCPMSPSDFAERSRHELVLARCRAGLHSIAAPIHLGDQSVALLVSGQFQSANDNPDQGLGEALTWATNEIEWKGDLAELQAAFGATQVVEREEFEEAVILLQGFAELLSGHLNSIVIEDDENEPEAVRLAKSLVSAHQPEEVKLEEASLRCNMASDSFSWLFETSTGLTFEEYVARRRIEQARRALIDR